MGMKTRIRRMPDHMQATATLTKRPLSTQSQILLHMKYKQEKRRGFCLSPVNTNTSPLLKVNHPSKRITKLKAPCSSVKCFPKP
jgi:hypothetical protein